MDFLLECIGFPPGFDPEALARLAEKRGEPAPWRDPAGTHKRLALGGGLELRVERAAELDEPQVWPYFASPNRLRVAVESLERAPESPYDALLCGRVNPPPPDAPELADAPYSIAAWLTDRRRLPHALPAGHVLAVSLAGFALDVTDVEAPGAYRSGPNFVEPIGGPDAPGAAVELCLPIERVQHLENPLTRDPVTLYELAAPGRRLPVFASPFERVANGLPEPAPGCRLRGAFLFTGRVTGGLPSASGRVGAAFG